MRILVACEESQAVTKELRRLGHEAYSCDIQEPSGGHPEWHIWSDCVPLLNGDCEFKTLSGDVQRIDGPWDMLIGHPPCKQQQLMAAMRKRGVAICEKYHLPGEAAPMIRAAIKAEVLGRWRVKNLHDLPESVLGDATGAIAGWDSYSLVRKIREQLSTRPGGEVTSCRR